MPDIPQAAINAAAAVLHEREHPEPCCTSAPLPRHVEAAAAALEAAEAVWPHEPPQRDQASTVNATTAFGVQRTVPPRGRFGFGPAEVRA